MLKKLGAIMMVAVVSCAPLAASGCGTEVINRVDNTKSVLYVNNYAGGFGSAWMDEVIARFESEYAEVSFEDGKTGVDIQINHNKDSGSEYLSKVESMNDEVFFPEKVYYYDWVKQGKLLDVSDIVEETNGKDGGKSILSKMTEEEKSFYKVDGKYYAIPHHEHQVGLVYDIDLFEEQQLYYAKNGAPSEDYALDKDANGGYSGETAYTGTGAKSAGPDGTHGTSDDGLPATYDEFFALCEYMSNPINYINVTPFLWNGKTRAEYIDWFLASLATDYEGVEQIRLNYTFNGTAKNLIQLSDGEVEKLPETEITSSNGYQIYSTAGRYYALDFLKRVVENPNYYDANSCFGSILHTEAQYQYLLGATDSAEKRYAFLVEGNWWENEATGSFDSIVKYNGGEEFSKTSRKFGFMPLPKATSDKIGEGYTVPSTDVTIGFIKSSIAPSKIELAKTFLQFCYTDESLNKFTEKANLPAALQYDLDDDVYNGLSAYAKGIWGVKDRVVKPYSTNPIYLNNYSKYSLIYTFSVSGKRAIEELRKTSVTAESYFEDLSSQYTATSWNVHADYFEN